MKIAFTSYCNTSAEDLACNKAHAKTLGFPRLGVAGHPSLAIVGGGPSVARHLKDLQKFEGEIWAINGAWKWCIDNGIEATFCCADGTPKVAKAAIGAKKAFVATHCPRELFDEIEDAEICAVDVGEKYGYPSGPTTATAFPLHALDRGHETVTFYGCESSWNTKTHLYMDAPRNNVMKVECGGKHFLTQPYLAMQAEIIAALIIAAPKVFSEQSGGLLRALTKTPELDVIAATQEIHNSLEMT